MEGLIAIVLLVGGGLSALQAVTILSGLPFAIIIIIMCYSLYKSLGEYYKRDYKRSVVKGIENKVIIEDFQTVSSN